LRATWPTTRRSGSPPSGTQITEITVLVNERRLSGKWVAAPTRHVVRTFNTPGDNIAESFENGDWVFVHGTITTRVHASDEARTTSPSRTPNYNGEGAPLDATRGALLRRWLVPRG
jgi:single-stranded DNA-binding protein